MRGALSKPPLTATLHIILILFVAAPASQFLNARPADAGTQTETKKTTDVLNAIDQLIEQNCKLEQKNRELMQQISFIRQLVPDANTTAQAAPAQSASSPVQPSTAGTGSTQQPASQTGNQSSGQGQSTGDDKTLLLKAAGGNPAIFGEFNPGRG